MAQHNELGKRGEDLAAAYLLQNNYQILQRNWSYDRNEIDIIASVPGFIVFVEVKTRTTSHWGNPEEAVSLTKIKRIVKAADYYLNANNVEEAVRFDVIAILLNKNNVEIEHIEDAFFAPIN
jgi:putative endonuclease